MAYEGDASKINSLLKTEKPIDEIFRQAQRAYNEWIDLPLEARTTEKLLKSLSFDFFEVLDSVTIARSRKHIEQFYDTADIGKFPTRLKPISKTPPLTDIDKAITFRDIIEIVQQLNLSIYTPSAFILSSKKDKYGIDTEDELDAETGSHRLSIEDRELGIRRLMGINMLKRLESSVNSFRLTISRIQQLVANMIDKIDSRSEDEYVEEFDFDDLDIEDEGDTIIGNKKNKIDLRDIDTITWRKYLADDKERFDLLLLMLKDINPAHDSKLQQLICDLREKFSNPINGKNKKVIIFTAFADTADYLYKNLSPLILEKMGLHTAMVSGTIEAKCTVKLKQKTDFNTVLTLFSPISKEKEVLFPNVKEEVDVLIATDCISEGQNLQDCDYLINYDIHWNPVRIIQRFGRIDRIGSKNEVIQLVNYWPDMELDDYIDLKGRVESRMKISVLTSTGDDNPLSMEEKGDLEYRRQQLKRLQEEVVDLEDMNTGISIMDLGLNEFRLDLLDYMHDGHDIEHTPYGMHAVVKGGECMPAGVIYVLRNRSQGVNIDHKNQLHPFYLVYVADDGGVVVNHLSPKTLLDDFRLLCKGKTRPEKTLCAAFNKETKDGKNMQHYSELLGKAIQSIINVKEKSDLDCFLEGVQTELFTKEIKGLDDFELIDFLIVR